MFKALLVIFILITVFFSGFFVRHYQLQPYPVTIELIRKYNHLTDRFAANIGYQDVAGRLATDCKTLPIKPLFTILILGQSNVANSGDVLSISSTGNIFNYHNGKCYETRDPILGATGQGGSIWPQFGDMLLQETDIESVVFVNQAVHGSTSQMWTQESRLFKRLAKTVEELKKLNIDITHVVWHQGESDALASISATAYVRNVSDLVRGIRSLGIDAPIFLSLATRCNGAKNEEIRKAQREIINGFDNVVQGPDTDDLDMMDDRHDGCHFSRQGMVKFSKILLDSILQRNQR